MRLAPRNQVHNSFRTRTNSEERANSLNLPVAIVHLLANYCSTAQSTFMAKRTNRITRRQSSWSLARPTNSGNRLTKQALTRRRASHRLPLSASRRRLANSASFDLYLSIELIRRRRRAQFQRETRMANLHLASWLLACVHLLDTQV